MNELRQHIDFYCIGELLWDVLPNGEYLGGAPLNVAAHLNRLGESVRLLTRIGNDERGERALKHLSALAINLEALQIDPVYPTGTAEAILLTDGSAQYRFPAPVAFDRIAMPTKPVHGCVIFGTLAQRDAISATSIYACLKQANYRVLDLNLRAPHDADEVILKSLVQVDFIKLNEYEVARLAKLFGLKLSADVVYEYLHNQYGIDSMCVTEGERGATLWYQHARYFAPAIAVSVVDTIGAGDAFLAMLLSELASNRPPADALARATRLAAKVVMSAGATPEYDPTLI